MGKNNPSISEFWAALSSGFLQRVADELASCGSEVGPGTVYRVVSAVQREFFDPPDLQAASGWSKYR